MQRRPLGRSGISVAPWGFGGNVLGWTATEPGAFRLLDAFVDAGFNLIDTADTYSAWLPGHRGGESEALIGRWLRESGRRDDVVLATKVGMKTASGEQGLSPAHIEASLAGSLERLGTDRIDLYQSHTDDASVPIADVLATYDRALRRGVVRAIGASNFTAARLVESLEVSRATGLPRYESLQPRYNLADRPGFEADLAPVCREHGLGVLPYASLAGGFLTGKYRSPADLSRSPRGGRMEARLNDRGRGILAALDSVAKRLDVAPASVALAWVVGRPGISAALASATTREQLEELIVGASLQLDAAAVAELERASG